MNSNLKALMGLAIIAMFIVPVMAQVPMYNSKYTDTGIDQPTQTGILRGQLACYHNLFSKEIEVTLEGSDNTVIVPISNSGHFELNDMSPGVYTLVLRDGNGGLPETTTATIVPGQISYPYRMLTGHAVTFDAPETQVYRDGITITQATYGMTRVVIDQAFVPAVPEVPEVPAVTHQEKIIDVPYQPATPATGVKVLWFIPGHVHADYLGHGHSQIDFYYNGQPMHITGNSHDDAFIVTPGTPEVPEQFHYITVVDVPAVPAIPAVPEVPEVSHVVGSYVDVTARVQSTIDNGATGMVFRFDNSPNPGGIFSEGTLRAGIVDPAPGQVKSVVIKYIKNDVALTINTMERTDITL